MRLLKRLKVAFSTLMKYVSMMKVSLLWGLGFLATIKAYGFIGHIVAAALTWDLLAPEV